ncbi:MAG: ABC transporter substrate-binding protein [Trueperaceae bacterium]|nr:MAG: ABC transporter substrate-binding protein [Trueperaceae bacterium]
MNRFSLLVGLFLLLAAGAVSAQSTLVFGQSGLPVSLDSADAQDGNSLLVARQITERLVDMAPGSSDLVAGLATSWSASKDSTVWTFSLRAGVNFHDGTPFNAEAVKFNFDRWNDPSHPYHLREEGKNYVPWSDFVFGGFLNEGSPLLEVRVVDDLTVEFHMDKPLGLFPNMLAAIYFQIDSPAAVMAAGADYGTPGVGSVGTGPFKFVEWREGELVSLERNDDYWGEVAASERLVIRGIQDPTARLAELRAGAIDIAIQLAPGDLPIVEGDPNLETALPDSELNVGYLSFHQGNPPFDNPLVREAVAYAIDRELIIDAFYEGLGTVAQDFLPPQMWGHSESAVARPYNPERAKVLLREAGFADGFDTELWFMPVSRPYFPSPEPIATAMATFLADVGINAELKTIDWATYLQQYRQGAFPMYMLGWNADYADPDNFLFTFFGPSAVDTQGWDDPQTRELLGFAREASDPVDRQELYAKVQTRVTEHVPRVPIAHNRSLTAIRTNVEGVIPSPVSPSEIPLHLVSKQ